jgi:Tat protein secretion system quality control protein TatD with DNase activity
LAFTLFKFIKNSLEILEKFGSTLPPIVIHCFTGNREEAQKYIDLGFYIGLTGISKKHIYYRLI